MAPLKLVNQHNARTISAGVELAVTRQARRKGLLGRDGMAASEALYLAPCFAIHTAFMRFRIDVVFVDAIGRVLKIVRNMPPWRMACAPRAHAVIELPGGTLGAEDLRVGDAVALASATTVS